MKENWKYQPLGEICDLLNGFAFKSNLYVNEGIRVIRIANVQKGYIEDSTPAFYPFSFEDELSRYMLQEGDLLMSLTGNVGRVGILHKEMLPAALNQRVACIRLKKKDVLLKYLFHYFNSDYFEKMCIASSHGAAQLNMSTVWLAKHLVPVPPLTEQERIVALLDDQFAKIDTLKANADQQLKAAKDLFQSALKEMLTPKEGWEEKELKDICTSIKDGDWIERKDQSISGIRLLQTGNIGVGIYKDKSDSPHYISLDTFNRLHCEEVFEGDILLSRLPEPVGRACLVPKMEGRFITAVDCSIIKLNTDKISPEYFIFYTQTNAYFKNISSLCTGTTRQRISRKRLEEVPISFPSLPEQERIAARLDAISEKVKTLQANYDQTINLCNDLKQALLKSIFA